MSIAHLVRSKQHASLVARSAFRSSYRTLVSQSRRNDSSPIVSNLETKVDTSDIRKPPDIRLAAGSSAPNSQASGLFRRFLVNANDLIEELSHMDEVRASQQKVMQLKDKLFESSQRKRQLLFQLSEVRRELKKINADSMAIRRGTDGYLALVHSEIKLLKEEESLQTTYDKADEEERNLFTSLTAAINDSYEKEKVHANTLRLWGLIGTLFTSIVTLILSTIGHYYHTTQLGLVGSKFKDTDKISSEVQNLRYLLIQVQQQIAQRITTDQQPAVAPKPAPSESWGAYLSRHTSRAYRYFFPKKQ